MCRFTTKLFNSPSLPGLEEFANQIGNVTGLQFADDELARCGHNIMGVERLINGRLGVRREHDTLPDRWFDEPVTGRPVRRRAIDRAEFDAMLSRFYDISGLDETGQPAGAWRQQLEGTLDFIAADDCSTSRSSRHRRGAPRYRRHRFYRHLLL